MSRFLALQSDRIAPGGAGSETRSQARGVGESLHRAENVLGRS